VNLVAPGFIDVGMSQKLTTEQSADVLSQIPLKRFGTTEVACQLILR
jgi:3-oxoacyl-[acyl-carrier protein] reductase